MTVFYVLWSVSVDEVDILYSVFSVFPIERCGMKLRLFSEEKHSLNAHRVAVDIPTIVRSTVHAHYLAAAPNTGFFYLIYCFQYYEHMEINDQN